MINHQNPKDSTWQYSDEEKGFLVNSVIDRPAGIEIFDSYGIKCNSRFLLNYGFVEQFNQSTTFVFKVVINDLIPLYNEKIEIYPHLANSSF